MGLASQVDFLRKNPLLGTIRNSDISPIPARFWGFPVCVGYVFSLPWRGTNFNSTKNKTSTLFIPWCEMAQWVFLPLKTEDDVFFWKWSIPFKDAYPTVDGSEIPNNHLECNENLVNNGINYQPQLVFSPDFWTINSISLLISAWDSYHFKSPGIRFRYLR